MKKLFIIISVWIGCTILMNAKKDYEIRQYMTQVKLHKLPQQGMDIVKNKIFVLQR